MNSSIVKHLGRTPTSYRLFIFALVGLSIWLTGCGQEKSPQPTAHTGRRKKTKTLTPNRKAFALNRQGGYYADIGQFDSALVCFHQALELSEQFDLKDRKFAALTNIANAYDERANKKAETKEQFKSELDSAGIYYTRCLDFISTLNDTAKEVKLLIDIGIFYHNAVLNLDRAETLFNRAVKLSRFIESKGDDGLALFCRGCLRYHKLELAAARQDFTDALPLLRKGAGEYFVAWDSYYINLLDTLIVKQKELSASEWKEVVTDRQDKIKSIMDHMKELHVVEPLQDGGE